MRFTTTNGQVVVRKLESKEEVLPSGIIIPKIEEGSKQEGSKPDICLVEVAETPGPYYHQSGKVVTPPWKKGDKLACYEHTLHPVRYDNEDLFMVSLPHVVGAVLK